MAKIYYIKDADGDTHGPFSKNELDENMVLISDPLAEVIIVEEDESDYNARINNDSQNQLFEYLQSLISSQTNYFDLPSDSRQEIEKHFYVLVRKGPQSWNDIEMNNYFQIIGIQGRKEFQDSFSSHETSSIMRCVIQHLEVMESKFDRIENIMIGIHNALRHATSSQPGSAASLNAINAATRISAMKDIRDFVDDHL